MVLVYNIYVTKDVQREAKNTLHYTTHTNTYTTQHNHYEHMRTKQSKSKAFGYHANSHAYPVSKHRTLMCYSGVMSQAGKSSWDRTSNPQEAVPCLIGKGVGTQKSYLDLHPLRKSWTVGICFPG